MTEKIKTNKGGADVKDDSTLLYSPNIIDLSAADIASDTGGDWDDFQLYGASGTGESEYRNMNDDTEVSRELMERIHNRAIGRKIQMLDLKVA